MKYGKIYTYENRNEAEIGKTYAFGDLYKDVCKIPGIKTHSRLAAVEDKDYPFMNSSRFYSQFIREVIEEPVLMTNRQLAEWLAKGNGQFKYDEPLIRLYHEYGTIHENEEVNNNIRIRPWDSDEWVVPTVDIYERDCK